MFKFDKISKQFSTQFVLNNFSFEISAGDKIIIVGRSGIGKTTLFRLLLGFEKPEKGSIYFENIKLTDQSVWELRKQVAYVSQDLNIGQGKVQTLFEETLSLKANLSFKDNFSKEIKSLFEYFDMSSAILTKDIEDLSGGEKQRVAIINALLLKRNIFFLDEITSALDVSLKTKVMNYFFKNPEFTVLSISHDNYMPEGIDVKTINLDKV